MESVEKNKAVLISDIEADARAEAEGIIKEAENQAADKRKYADKQVESLLNDARKRAEEQAQAVMKKALSTVELELKRRSLHLRATVIQEIMDRVEKRLDSMIRDADYRSVLLDWIAEAAIGLGAESAQVNASTDEQALIDDQLLAQACGKVRARTGTQIALTLSTAEALEYQGVVLTAADGRTAFNNQVRTRLLRSQRKIRMLIYDTLFGDDRRK
jgi:V/A-type H+-transporting ATPase subunit E